MATWGQRLEEASKVGTDAVDVEAVLGEDYRKARDADRAGVAGVASVLQHLTRARHMCYRRMFLLETCLRWNGGAPLKPETCRESRMLFSACNSELYVVCVGGGGTASLALPGTRGGVRAADAGRKGPVLACRVAQGQRLTPTTSPVQCITTLQVAKGEGRVPVAVPDAGELPGRQQPGRVQVRVGDAAV